MIKIIFYPNGFTATGHANSNEYGHDLVCAGVSAIIMGSLNWFGHSSTLIAVEENYIKVVDKENNISHLLNLLLIQLKAMQSAIDDGYLSINEINTQLL